MVKAIVIQGAPGVGKTTLARRLSKDLDIKCLIKDDIKEFLYDSLGAPVDRDESGVYGHIAIHALFSGLSEFTKAGQLVLIESNFVPEYAVADLSAIIDLDAILQLHVYCTPAAQKQRFITRTQDGSRHGSHFDEIQDVVDTLERHTPIAGIKTISIDTTHFGEDEYKEILRKVQIILSEGTI